MKWMNGWSVDDLNACSPELYREIVDMIIEEQEEYERARE